MVRQRDTASAPRRHRGLLLETLPSLPSPSMENGQSDREVLVGWGCGIVWPITAFVWGSDRFFTPRRAPGPPRVLSPSLPRAEVNEAVALLAAEGLLSP